MQTQQRAFWELRRSMSEIVIIFWLFPLRRYTCWNFGLFLSEIFCGINLWEGKFCVVAPVRCVSLTICVCSLCTFRLVQMFERSVLVQNICCGFCVFCLCKPTELNLRTKILKTFNPRRSGLTRLTYQSKWDCHTRCQTFEWEKHCIYSSVRFL